MQHFSNSPFEGQLDVVATLSDMAIQSSLADLREQDRLTLALREMLKSGVPIDELSAASGLTPAEIRRRSERELSFGEDLASIAGNR